MNEYMSLKDHVYNFISDKINNGSLTPNEKISEQQICDELNISRTPVREALIQLSTEGYIENLPRKGFKVKHIDEKKAIELYTIIGVLDGTAASLAVENISKKELNHMKYLISAMDIAINNSSPDIYYKLQMDFHNEYIAICGNTELIKLLNQLKKNFMRQKYLISNTQDVAKILKSTNDQHKVIVELFEKKDKDKLQNYLKNVHWNVEKAVFDSF